MKKRIFIVSVCVLLGLIVSAAVYAYTSFETPATRTTSSARVNDLPHVTLILQEATNVTTYKEITARTPYDALVQVSQQHTIPLKIKQYDFGAFVEAIGTSVSSKEFTWVYFINGKAGDAASDKKLLQTGDVVEWKYIQPIE